MSDGVGDAGTGAPIAQLASFRHTMPFTVRVNSIDVFGHLNNVAIFRLLETSRCEYAVDVGLTRWNDLSHILARVNCNFRAQAHHHDRLVCGCKTVRIGGKSFELRQEIWRSDGVLIADADTVFVTLGPDKKTSVRVPAEWRKKLSAWEKVELEIA